MPGHTLDELLAVIDEELAKLAATPPEPIEVERARNQIEFQTLHSLEPILARAERLQAYNDFAGDPGYLATDLRAYAAVDPAAVQRTVATYLRKQARVVITVAPNPDAPIMGRVKP